MRFRRRQTYRRLSAPVSRAVSILEPLEQRQLLSSTNGSDVGTDEAADPALTAYRQRVFDHLAAQADEQYGELYGQETSVWRYPDEIIPLLDQWRLPQFNGIEAVQRVIETDSARSEVLSFDTAEIVSDTNVQVAGVDEGDIVETDGTHIFVLRGNKLTILSAATETAPSEVVSQVTLSDDGHGRYGADGEMILFEDRLTIVVPHHTRSYRSFSYYFKPQTTIVTFDVSDPTAPEVVQESIVDGKVLGTRAVSGQLYVSLSNTHTVPFLPTLQAYPDEETTIEELQTTPVVADLQWQVIDYGGYGFRVAGHYESREEYMEGLRALVFGSETEPGIFPLGIYQRTANDSLHQIARLDGAASEVIASSSQIINILRFDTTSTATGPVDDLGIQTDGIYESWSSIYATESTLYLTSLKSQNSAAGHNVSTIHKIDLTGDSLTLAGKGEVPGRVHDQFSLDEHNGYLRVATTTFDQPRLNHVFILEDAGDELVEVGSVRDLAPTERIYSMRYDGDRAWMVTFRESDPVFSLDLSDPTNPQVTGELKIPGFSDYLQLIDENHLLAIGRGATSTGRAQEVQVSLFDVSDMTAPTLLHRHSFDGGRSGSSEALYEHHAFQYLPDQGILAIPFTDWSRPHNEQSGLVTLKIDAAEGITELGEVFSTGGAVLRSVRIDELLYSINDRNAQVIDLADTSVAIDEIAYEDESVPDYEQPVLLKKFRNRLRDLIQVSSVEDSAEERVRIELTDLFDSELPGVGDMDFEFRLRDAVNGEEVLRQVIEEPLLELSELEDSLPDPGVFDLQYRTRSSQLSGATWSDWSDETSVSIGEEVSRLVSERILRFEDQMVKWSAIPDRILPAAGETAEQTNPVDHYEFWLSDANRRETVAWIRDLESPEYDLSENEPGDYWGWFRPVFADGSFGDWSDRESFSLLGRKLTTEFPEATANAFLNFGWESLADAVNFEVEITSTDGTQVHSATDIIENRLQLLEELQAGDYSIRIRAALPNGGYTEWTDAHPFTVVGRPEPVINGDTITWGDNGAIRHEVWISELGSTDAVVHEKSLTRTQLRNALENLGERGYGKFSVWMKSWMADGTSTGWSIRQTMERFAEAVDVNEVSSFLSGHAQSLSWNEAAGVESYEVYVQKKGEAGAVFREAGITDLAVSLTEQLGNGDYLWWVRGALAGGGFTKWGPAHELAVNDTPVLSAIDNAVSWLSDPNATNAEFEVWANRVDDNFSLLEARALHVLDAVGGNIDLSSLIDGKYNVWVRQIKEINGEIVKSDWSNRVVVDVSTISDLVNDVIDDVTSVFEDGLDNLLDVL